MPKNITHGNFLSNVMEDYLEAIYHIVKANGFARSKNISEALKVDKSTVTTALHFLEKGAYINYAPYRDVTLTKKGEKEAEGIIRRHEAMFRLLHNLLGLEEKEAVTLACEMEHSISPDIANKFIKLVDKAVSNNKKNNKK